MNEITAAELQQRLAAGQAPFLLDVREPAEFAQGHVPGATLIPLGTLVERVQELPRDSEIVAICRSGNRSGMATQWLESNGYRVRNLVGGMLGWQGPVES